MSNIAFGRVCESTRHSMKLLLLTISIFLSVSAMEWHEYKRMYGKYYSPREDTVRLQLFINTTRMVEEHKLRFLRGEVSYEIGINQYADWFPEEKNQLFGLKPSFQSRGDKFEVLQHTVVPEAINWVEIGAVTSVKDQGKCGSCYAFSAAGALEGLMFRTNRSLFTDLSAQELIDCTPAYGNVGCDGGKMTNCFKYVKHRRGIDSELSYPYLAVESLCMAKYGKTAGYCTGYVDVSSENENLLTQAVGTVGPVAVGFAAPTIFINYDKGIYDGPCSNDLNHGMLVVGYGFDEKLQKKYWLVKNSWGSKWGEKGYVRIERGFNKCLISSYASYPIIND